MSSTHKANREDMSVRTIGIRVDHATFLFEEWR